MNARIINFAFVIFFLFFGNVYSKRKQAIHVINYASPVFVCSDDVSKQFFEVSDLKPERINETVAMLDGDFKFLKTMDGLVKMEGTLEKVLKSGGKEMIATVNMKNYCDELKNRETSDSMFAYYFRATNFPNCPIPPGEYRIINMIANTKSLPLNSFVEGEYLLTFNFYQSEIVSKGLFSSTKDTFLGCIYFSCTVDKV